MKTREQLIKELQETRRQLAERKVVEKTLRESEEKFSKAFHATPDLISIATLKDGRIIEVNDSFTRITGYSREEVIGLSSTELNMWVDPADRDRIAQAMEQEGRIRNIEIEFRKKSGETHWVLFSAELVNIGGEPCIIAVSTDITERKQAEEKLQAIIKTALDGFWISNLEGRLLEVNDSYCKMTGYTHEELLEMSIQDIEATENPEQTAQHIKKIVKNSSDRFETQHRRKDGKIIDIDISVNYLNIEEGQLFVFARDITERKQAEEALRESEEKFSKAFHASPDGITISRLSDGTFLEVNEGFLRSIGYTREEIIGHSSSGLGIWLKAGDREKMLKLLKENGRVANEEYSFRTKSSEILTMLFSAELINIGDEPCLLVLTTDITERKRAEEELLFKNALLEAQIETNIDGIMVVDENDKIILCNKRFQEIHRIPQELLETKDDKQVLQHVASLVEDTEAFKKRIRYLYEHKEEREHDEIELKDGRVYERYSSPLIDANGIYRGRIWFIRDITERKRAENALRESQKFVSSLLENAPHATTVINPDTSIRYVNPAWEELNGWTSSEIIGTKAPYPWWPDEYKEEFFDGFNEAMRQGGGKGEITHQKKNGEIYWNNMNWAPVMHNGELQYLLINSVDITERKRVEEQLRLLSSVTQQVSDSTIVTDPDFKITYMNQAAQDLFGYTIEEVRGKSLGIFNDKPVSKKSMQEKLRILSSGKVWSGTATKRRKDGSTFICDCRLSPLFDEKGQICSYIDVQRDITRQKEVEDKLQAQKQLIELILATIPEGVLVIDNDDRIILANKTFHRIFHTGKKSIVYKLLDEIIPVDQLFNLYRAVRQGETEKNTLEFRYQVKDHEKIIICVINKMGGERTLLTFIDISQEREEEEKLYLTDRLASIGEMAAGLAHELNNPLTSILALSQLLMDSDIPEEHREDLQYVYSEAKRAANIVKNVLLFTRNNNYENGRASTNEVIRDILRLREYEEKVSNITTATNLQENLPDIPVDKFQLQQVFLNIILNAEAAIKETNRPGTLLVTTERVNNHINIHFKDNGCGIKKHVLPRIFDPFFTTKDVGKGTGLGLSICYGIVSKHGGKISVKTQENKGTIFTVRMPIAPQMV